jgi:hypothetical protein
MTSVCIGLFNSNYPSPEKLTGAEASAPPDWICKAWLGCIGGDLGQPAMPCTFARAGHHFVQPKTSSLRLRMRCETA